MCVFKEKTAFLQQFKKNSSAEKIDTLLDISQLSLNQIRQFSLKGESTTFIEGNKTIFFRRWESNFHWSKKDNFLSKVTVQLSLKEIRQLSFEGESPTIIEANKTTFFRRWKFNLNYFCKSLKVIDVWQCS